MLSTNALGGGDTTYLPAQLVMVAGRDVLVMYGEQEEEEEYWRRWNAVVADVCP
jgi:hypothetical protein